MTDLGPLTKVSANFTERSVTALDKAAELSGHSHTDCINRAVQMYAEILQARAEGGAGLKVTDVAPALRIEVDRPWWRFW